ncbi:MAG: AarF/ABC1/UbiB kinase family protein [Deltaproteobacteria bacterium]|nr:AarF/ABC1/UbiB kinase family protein [Deltaproteobacteria bacterium]
MKAKTAVRTEKAGALAIPRELTRLVSAWWRFGVFGLPTKLTRSLVTDTSFESIFSGKRFYELFGDNALRLFDALGPIYGKAGQIALSRMSPKAHAVADDFHLTRLYKDWPALPWSQVQHILDTEIPQWRVGLKVEPVPLGVASMAQVHAATSSDGRQWVVKVLKPQAKQRMMETTAALDQLIAVVEPLALTQVSKRTVRELRELVSNFRRETSLIRERDTIIRLREKLAGKKQGVLLIPEVNTDYCSQHVLTVERFMGISLSDVVAGKIELPPTFKQKLAKSVLSELLVQVFELGLFHADPHAGNLILMETGDVGLFDWGLAGELFDSDRRYIAAILKAVIALDQEQLIDALVAMGTDVGREVEREDVRKELKTVSGMIKKGRENPAEKASIQELLEACLNSAARLGIAVPDGLLLMAKSLVTIEGLARGIDPQVSLARVATPVLFKAAKPGWKEVVAFGRRLPSMVRMAFN